MQSDKPGRQNPFTAMLSETFDSLMRSVMVCLPGKVLAFDPATQLAQVECGIQRVIDGRGVTIPVIENVPVQFAGNDQWYFWHEITPGTEGLIHFSQRAIDTWLDRGGPAQPHDTRMFSAEDAFFVPGVRSRPGVIPNFENSGVGLSSYDGETCIHLTPGAIVIKGGAVTIDASTVTIAADVATTGALTNNGVNVSSTHTHPQGADSGGNSEADTGPPQ